MAYDSQDSITPGELEARSMRFNQLPDDVMQLKLQLFAKDEYLDTLMEKHKEQLNFAKAQALKLVETYVHGQFYEYIMKTLAEEPQVLDIWNELFAILKLTRPEIEQDFKDIVKQAQQIQVK